jgi:hypothetical protein
VWQAVHADSTYLVPISAQIGLLGRDVVIDVAFELPIALWRSLGPRPGSGLGEEAWTGWLDERLNGRVIPSRVARPRACTLGDLYVY